MALCCIGGVCVPYSAVVPLMVLGLQWLLGQLAAAGLLPPAVVHALRRFLPSSSSTSTTKSNIASSCCDRSATSTNQRRSKISKQASTVTTTASCCSDENEDATTGVQRGIVFLETEEELTELLSLSESVTVVVKFTATWCKPCQAIQPLWEQLAQEQESSTTTNTSTVFAVADADELDEAAARYGVVALPTFVAYRGGKVLEKYAGSSETKLREFCARVMTPTTAQ